MKSISYHELKYFKVTESDVPDKYMIVRKDDNSPMNTSAGSYFTLNTALKMALFMDELMISKETHA